MKACIFDVQRASFVDGPGIRTTIFFQGCNLRCKWCHNPESWETTPRLMFFESHCIHCGVCARFCPSDAIAPDGKTNRSCCAVCGECTFFCPQDARQVCGREVELDTLVQTVMRDQVYYNESGGGLTISGGECMLQIDMLQELLRRIHSKGLSTAIDTAGHVPWSSFERILSVTDFILFDIKCLDPAIHRRCTGVDNALILENFRKLLALCREKLIVRVPVIPGYNDLDGEMEHVATFIRDCAINKVEFIPYHRLGEDKNAALGLVPFVADVPSKARIKQLEFRALETCNTNPDL